MNFITSRAHWIGPLLFVLVLSIPTSLSLVQQKFLAIFSMVMANWLFTNLPLSIPGLLGVALTVLMGISTPEKALAPLSSPIIFLFFGGFMLARAMSNQQLDKRLSLMLLSSSLVKGSFSRMVLAIIAVSGFFSMWVSNTATTAMMLPIVIGTLHSLGIQDKKLSTLLLLVTAYSSSIGGIGSPIGSPPNIIGIGMLRSMAQIEVSFFFWMAIAVPIMIVFLGILFLYVRRFIPYEIKNFDNTFLKLALSKLPTMNSRDLTIMLVFVLTVFLWFVPSLLQSFLPSGSNLLTFVKQNLEPGIVGILCSSLLFFLPWRGTDKILKFEDISKIDWNSLLLFGCGLSLGQTLFDTGLAKLAADFILSGLSGVTIFIMFIVVVYFMLFSTELVSNTAAANILLPVIIAMALELNFSPMLIVMAAAFACSLAFMLPVGTPPNAIVYGTGQVQLKDMMKYGLWLNLILGLLMGIYCYLLSLVL